MASKEFAVFGLGRFGMSIAETLAQNGCEVIAIDAEEERVQDIADKVTYAMKANVTEKEVLQNLGIGNLDGVIIAIAENLEASIMTTILAKELGAKYVLAKAQNELHATVLRKVGADAIIFPEKEMGARIANSLASGNFVDLIELSSKFSIAEVKTPEKWVGRNLRELNVRDKYGVNVIAVKRGDNVDAIMDPNEPMHADETLILAGNKSDLQKIT